MRCFIEHGGVHLLLGAIAVVVVVFKLPTSRWLDPKAAWTHGSAGRLSNFAEAHHLNTPFVRSPSRRTLQYVRKFLDEVDDQETREEFLCIDYTPIITHAPIDMFEVREQRQLDPAGWEPLHCARV